MHGNEDHVPVLVHQLHHLMHPTLVIPHSHQSSEYADTMVYMDYVVAYIEGTQVIESKLLALLHAAAYGHPVEAVEYLVVGVAAYSRLVVNEAVMQVLARLEFRKQAIVLRKNRTQPVQLSFFFSVYDDLVTALYPASYVRLQQFEVLVENGLGTDFETYRIRVPLSHRNFQEHTAESCHIPKERLLIVHVG